MQCHIHRFPLLLNAIIWLWQLCPPLPTKLSSFLMHFCSFYTKKFFFRSRCCYSIAFFWVCATKCSHWTKIIKIFARAWKSASVWVCIFQIHWHVSPPHYLCCSCCCYWVGRSFAVSQSISKECFTYILVLRCIAVEIIENLFIFFHKNCWLLILAKCWKWKTFYCVAIIYWKSESFAFLKFECLAHIDCVCEPVNLC